MADNLSTVISKVSPVLSSALNAFLPGSGFIVSGIAKLFGADSNSEEDIIKKIQADPEAYLKLRAYELEHYSSLLQIALEDKKSARQRETDFVKQTGKRDWILDFLSIFIVLGFFSLIMIVAFTKLDQTDHDILYLLTGQLSGSFLLIISYYFGSSVPVKPTDQTIRHPQTPDVILPPPAQTK